MPRSYIVTIVACFGLVLLHVIGFFYPVSLTWGFHFLGFLPSEYLSIYLTLAVFCLAFAFSKKSEIAWEAFATAADRNPKTFIASVTLTFILFSYYLRVGTPLLGDGIFLMKNFAETLSGSAQLFLRNEPLASLYYFTVMKTFGAPTYDSFMLSFWQANCIAGIGFIVAAYTFSRTIFDTAQPRLLTFLLLCSGAYMQLFLGYVETYPIVMMWLMIFSALSALYIKKDIPFLWLPLCFLIQGVSHYLTFLTLPALLYLSGIEIRRHGAGKVFVGILLVIAGLTLTLWIADFNIARLTAYVPHKHYLSLSRNAGETEFYSQAYTLLSPFHLLDILNMYILLSPSAIMMIGAGIAREKRNIKKDSLLMFLVLAVIPIVLFTLFANYDLGAAKDWDVPALLFPFIIALGSALFLRQGNAYTYKTAGLLVAITLLNSMTWFSLNASKEPAVARIHSLLDTRNVSRLGYYATSLHLSSYYHQINQNHRSIPLWQQYSRQFPDDRNGYLNTLINLELISDTNFAERSKVYETWLTTGELEQRMKTEYAKLCMDAGTYYFRLDRLETAKLFFSKAKRITPASAEVYNNLGSVYAMQESTDLAIEHFQAAIMLDSLFHAPYMNLGNILSESGNHEQSEQFFRKAQELGGRISDEVIEITDTTHVPPHLL